MVVVELGALRRAALRVAIPVARGHVKGVVGCPAMVRGVEWDEPALVRGVVEVHENGKVVNRFMIDGGLADVSGEAVTILTERAEDLDQANRDDVKSRADAASGAEADFLKAVLQAL